MGFLGVAHGWGVSQNTTSLVPKICQTYPTMMKLGSFPLPKEDPKIYESLETPLEFC